MTKRVFLSGVVGGVALFAWGAVVHMYLGLYEPSVKSLPHEAALVGTLQQAIREPGFYFFPGFEPGQEKTEAGQKAWAEKMARGPHGILVYHPEGGEAMSPRQLLIELAGDVLAALIAAWLLATAAGGVRGFGARLLFVTLLGLLAWVVMDLSYWNWYGFPGGMVVASLIEQVGGFFLAGLLLAALIRPAPR